MSQKTSEDKNTRPVDRCTECGSSNLIYDYDIGERVCGNCGLVYEEQMMDKGPEYRVFNPEQGASRIRVGASTTYTIHDKGLSTNVGRRYEHRDAFGKQLPPSTKYKIWRLRNWQTRTRVRDSSDRNLAQAMTELERLSSQINIPQPIKEKAAVIYRKALDKGLVRGRSIIGLTAAALYAACRRSENPRTLREITDASLVKKSDVTRTYRLILRELDLQMPVATPLMYVSKIANLLNISGKTEGIAIKIIREAKKKRGTGGKGPTGLAAAALYIACLQNNEKKNQRQIAEAAGVTEVTVRNRYKSLKRELDLEVDTGREPLITS